MIRKFGILAILFLLLPACASYTSPFEPMQTPGAYQAHDLSFSWRIQKQPGALIIKGFVKNNFYYYVTTPEIFANLLDENGNQIGKEAVYLVPYNLPLDKWEPFTFTFPLNSSVTPKKVKFDYRYRLGSYTKRWWYYGKFMITLNGA